METTSIEKLSRLQREFSSALQLAEKAIEREEVKQTIYDENKTIWGLRTRMVNITAKFPTLRNPEDEKWLVDKEKRKVHEKYVTFILLQGHMIDLFASARYNVLLVLLFLPTTISLMQTVLWPVHTRKPWTLGNHRCTHVLDMKKYRVKLSKTWKRNEPLASSGTIQQIDHLSVEVVSLGRLNQKATLFSKLMRERVGGPDETVDESSTLLRSDIALEEAEDAFWIESSPLSLLLLFPLAPRKSLWLDHRF